MTTECAKCQDHLIHNEDAIDCSECMGKFHFYCAGYNESAFKKRSKNTKLRFVCNECKQARSNSKTKITYENVISEKKFEELIASVNFMGNQFDDFNKKMDFILKEIKDLKSENSKIITDNKLLKEEINVMKEKIDDLEQKNIGNSIEIKVVPKSLNENCADIVLNIAKKSNSNISLKSTYRIYSPDKNTNIIVAEFMKDFLKKVKSMRLNANMIYNNWSTESKIFVNERFTKNKRTLFSKARSVCKEKGYKYVWVNNAEILIKKDDGGKTLRIKSENDIINL